MSDFKVLLIEDDDTARNQLARFIRKEGFDVTPAENGRVGLEKFDQEPYDIVITDVKMPDIDGLEVMHRIRAKSKKVQIILITAFGETDTVIMAIREGALDYLKKPIDLDQLTVTLGMAKDKLLLESEDMPFPTILLVDDDEPTRNRLASMLEDENWRVLQASDGMEALNMFKETKIDVAVLDIKMPKLDGIQSLHQMRCLTDDFESIILTGYGDEKNAIQALRDGAMSFLKKPIDIDQLVVTVRKALDKINLNRALKYRTRELELSKKIIAQITMENEIVIDSRKGAQTQIKAFANKLLDIVPLGLAVLNQNKDFIYVNSKLTNLIEYECDGLDEEFVSRLARIGIHDLSYDALISNINKLAQAPKSDVVNLTTGKYSFVALVPMTILDDQKKETVILMAMRGER